MSLLHCPHCGAENFTMEGWEDLDHCSSCGKPLGKLERGAAGGSTTTPRLASASSRRAGQGNGHDVERPRPA